MLKLHFYPSVTFSSSSALIFPKSKSHRERKKSLIFTPNPSLSRENPEFVETSNPSGMGKVLHEISRPSSSSASTSSTTTSSTSITETVNGSHHYKVNGYSLSKGMGIGKYLPSETFMVGGYAWAVYFYPDGKSSEDNAAYVSLFIALASEGIDVRALFELTLLDQSGRERHKVHSHFGRTLESGPYTLKYRGSMWYGYRSLLETTNL